MPTNPLKSGFERNAALLEYSIESDTVLRPSFGEGESRRYYIDLEYLGNDPFNKLNPAFPTMERLSPARSLSAPVSYSGRSRAKRPRSPLPCAGANGAGLLRHAGYLAYFADASQRCTLENCTMVSRRPTAGCTLGSSWLEWLSSCGFASSSCGQVNWQTIASVWTPVNAEPKASNALLARPAAADRVAHAEPGTDQAAYTQALKATTQDMIVHQIATAASALASIWLNEDRQAGSPAACSPNVQPSALSAVALLKAAGRR